MKRRKARSDVQDLSLKSNDGGYDPNVEMMNAMISRMSTLNTEVIIHSLNVNILIDDKS